MTTRKVVLRAQITRFDGIGMCSNGDDELNPCISVWTTQIRSDYNDGLKYYEIDYDPYSRRAKRTTTLDIPVAWKTEALSDKKIALTYKSDDAIWFECICSMKNEDGEYVTNKCGCGRIYLHEIVKHAASSNGNREFTKTLYLVVPVCVVNDKPFAKIRMDIKIEMTQEFRNQSREAVEIDGIGPTLESDYTIEKMISNMCSKTSYYFKTDALQSNMGVPPITPYESKVHMPRWISNVDLPGVFYFFSFSKIEVSEEFIENVLSIALEVNGLTLDWFIKTAEELLSLPDNGKLSYDHLKATSICVEAYCMVSCFLPYRCDEVYVPTETSRQDSDGFWAEVTEKYRMDSFDDVFDTGITIRDWLRNNAIKSDGTVIQTKLRLPGGDCEDVIKAIQCIAIKVDHGITELKDAKVWHKKHGGWKRKTVDTMQRIAKLFVPCSSLATASAPHFTSSDNHFEICSKEDKESTRIPHDTWRNIPVVLFEEMMNRCKRKDSPPFKFYDGHTHKKWESQLEILVGEGTGWVDPLFRPADQLEIEEKSKAANMKRVHDSMVNVLSVMDIDHSVINDFKVKRKSRNPKSEPNKHISSYYRTTVSLYTDKLYYEGHPYCIFYYVQKCMKRPKQIMKDGKVQYIYHQEREETHEGWVYGCYFIDEICKAPFIGLVPLPKFTDKELDLVSQLMRHMKPRKSLTMANTNDPSVMNQLRSYASAYNDTFSSAKKRKSAPNIPQNTEPVVVAIRFPKFTNKDKLKRLAESYARSDSVIHSDASIRWICDSLAVMLIKIYPNNEYILKDITEHIENELSESIDNMVIQGNVYSASKDEGNEETEEEKEVIEKESKKSVTKVENATEAVKALIENSEDKEGKHLVTHLMSNYASEECMVFDILDPFIITNSGIPYNFMDLIIVRHRLEERNIISVFQLDISGISFREWIASLESSSYKNTSSKEHKIYNYLAETLSDGKTLEVIDQSIINHLQRLYVHSSVILDKMPSGKQIEDFIAANIKDLQNAKATCFMAAIYEYDKGSQFSTYKLVLYGFANEMSMNLFKKYLYNGAPDAFALDTVFGGYKHEERLAMIAANEKDAHITVIGVTK